ncbi:hypothetical protein EON65_41675 [archaeon]|nr:MAG: hypothetical protein EON65_41675 [archaeon]
MFSIVKVKHEALLKELSGLVKEFEICEGWLAGKTYASGRNPHMQAACHMYWNLKQIINEHGGHAEPDESGDDEEGEGEDSDADTDGDHADDSGFLSA